MTSVVSAGPARSLADRCPGLLRPHTAEDGSLVRLRIPGGQTSSAVLSALSALSVEFGEGSLQLTSRGNLQLRGLAPESVPPLVDHIAALGLLPSVTHERVRNIVASPLTGLTPDRVDLRPLVGELDRALCATPELADLPGRFLFALDDGRSDVSSLRFDLAYVVGGPDESSGRGTVLVGGLRHGIATTASDAVRLLIALALQFGRLRQTLSPPPWHISELAEPHALDPRVRPLRPVPQGAPTEAAPRLGAVGTAASVGVPLSRLEPEQVRAIHEAAGGGPVVLTPWRGVIIPGASAELPSLAASGLITDEDSAWSQLTACVGGPACAKSSISTRTLATELVDSLSEVPSRPIHLSGCSRRCGAPTGRFVDLVAPESVEQALTRIEQFS